MKRAMQRLVIVSVVALGLSTASCETALPSEQGPGIEETTSNLFVANGTTTWNNNNYGTSAVIPVCFVVRPWVDRSGTTHCPSQTQNSDCDGNTVNKGVTLSPSYLRTFIRTHVEDTWMRYGNVEFIGWGDCAIDSATGKHLESSLVGTIMIHFRAGDESGVGKDPNGPTHTQYNWFAIQDSSDHDVGNVVHEIGHAIGFTHEWERPDWTNWKCVSGPVASRINGNCMEVAGGNQADGTAIQLASCDGTDRQSWSQGWTGSQLDGTLRAFGKCLDINGGSTASGAKVQLWSCNGGSNQQWVMRSDRSFFNPASGRCLDAPFGQIGTQLQIYDCNGGSNQQFSVPGNQITSGLSGSKCIDISGGNTDNGTKVQLWDCNRTDGQNFTQGFDGVHLDGTLRVLGKCLDVTNSQTANGTKVQLWDCNGTAAQQWVIQSNGSIKNPNSGRCLDVFQKLTANGTQIQIYDCNGGSNQRWNVANNTPGNGVSTPADPISMMQYCLSGGVIGSGKLAPYDIIGLQFVYGRKYHGSLVGYRGQCANIQRASTATGTPIISWPCRGAWNDTWFRIPSSTSEQFQTPSNSRCLNVSGGTSPMISWTCDGTDNERFTTTEVEWRAMGNMCIEAVGSGLQLQKCNGGNSQKWDFFHPVGDLRNDQIRASGTNLCVSASTTTGALGENLVLVPCSSSDSKQRFSTPGGGLLTLSNNTGLCANVLGGNTDTGSVLGLWNGCSTSSAPSNERFTISGQIKSLGNCLTMTDFAAQSQDVTCDANNTTTQIWEYYF